MKINSREHGHSGEHNEDMFPIEAVDGVKYKVKVCSG